MIDNTETTPQSIYKNEEENITQKDFSCYRPYVCGTNYSKDIIRIISPNSPWYARFKNNNRKRK